MYLWALDIIRTGDPTPGISPQPPPVRKVLLPWEWVGLMYIRVSSRGSTYLCIINYECDIFIRFTACKRIIEVL